MKKSLTIIVMGLLIATMTMAQEAQPRGAMPVTIYAGLGATSLDGAPVLSLDARLSYGFRTWLDVGVRASAFHTLEREYEDGAGRPYQAESGLSGLFIRPNWDITDRLNGGITLEGGTQMIRLRYSGELRDSMVWTEEVPDQVMVAYSAASLSLELRLCPRHSLYLEGGYRQVHPFRTPYMEDEDETGGAFASLCYGFSL